MDEIVQSLPEPLRAFVCHEVASGRYEDSTAFIVALISAERKKRLVERVETLIQEAYDSGEAEPWTKEDWEFIRSEVRSRLARRQESAS